MSQMIIVFLGAPGAGKGTQAEILEERLQMVHISSGDLLREHIQKGTQLGKVAKGYMDEGALVPDNLIIEMIVERIAAPDAERGILLDGFPRTLPQARALDDALSLKGKRVNAVLYINVDDGTLIERLTGRLTCRKGAHVFHVKFAPPKVPGICDICGGELYQREDDKYEKVAKRLSVYNEQTTPIIEYYRNRKLVCEVNGDRPIERVTEDLLNCLR